MKLKVLGCSGGIGKDLRTTSFLLDDDILIDAGTGVGDLTLEELRRIDHIFITHAHLDHIASIPFLVDTVGWLRDKPITLHATAETQLVLKQHLFNWHIWPDFSVIPSAEKPFMAYRTIALGETVALGGRRITPLPANHVVPTVGFHIDSGAHSLVFSGDTTTCDALWEAVNRIENLRYLIIETAFCEREKELAVLAKHYCPSLLAEDLRKLRRPAEIYITHLKPNEIELTMKEIMASAAEFRPRMLSNGQLFNLKA
ncbi:MAG: 3',5'-cyclic-nucleotide phosphodiesterase [Sulfuricella sp.]|nr:3',5'-cyclic-nucleotide phosphodiesterase [Sulfuricella sp.]